MDGMRSGYITKKTIRSMLVTSIMMVLVSTLGTMINSIFVGWFLGSDQLAALGVASSISLVFAAVAGLLDNGGNVRAAIYIGKNQRDNVNNVFTQTLAAAVLIGAVLTLLITLTAKPLALILGAHEQLISPAADYIWGMGFGIIPVIIATILMNFVRVDGSINLPLIAAGAMTVVNCVLDILMIKVFDAGLLGVAWATDISYVIAVLVCCLHFRKGHHSLKLCKMKNLVKELKAILWIGVPGVMANLYNVIKAAMLNNLAFSIAGVTAVTALAVRSNVFNIFFALFLGVGIAIIPIASIYFGEEDKEGLRNAVKYTLKAGIILNVIAGAIIFAFPKVFIALFGVTDPEVAMMSIVAIRMFAVSMPFACVVLVLDNYYLSCSNMFIVNFSGILQCLLIPLLFAFVLSGFLGVSAIWIALLLAEILTIAAIPVAIRAKTGKWPKTLDDLLMFPEGFGGDPQKRLNISIGNSMEEVVRISQKVGEFCTSQGITDKRAYMMSLAIEEMAGNVVLHGFEPGGNRYLDICVLYKNEELILTLRDNGKRFHPFEYVDALPAGEDPFKSIGIKMIRNMAKTVDYSYALGLNNIIIRI